MAVLSALALIKLWAAERDLVVVASFWHIFLIDAPETNIIVHVDDAVKWASIKSSDLESSWLGAHIVGSHFPVTRFKRIVIVVPVGPVVASWAIASGKDWAADLDGEVLASTTVLLAVDAPETDVKIGMDWPGTKTSIKSLSSETSWVSADLMGIEAREELKVALSISSVKREPAGPGVTVLSAGTPFHSEVAIDCWVRRDIGKTLTILVLGEIFAVWVNGEIIITTLADWAVLGFEAPLVLRAPFFFGSLTSHGLVGWAAERDFEVSAWHTTWLLLVQAVESFKRKMSDSIGSTVVAGLCISDLCSHWVKASLVWLKVVEHFPVTSSRSIVNIVEGSPFPSLDVTSTDLHLGAAISDLEISTLSSALLIVETVETNGSVDMSVLNRAIISSLCLSSDWVGASFVAGVLGECFVITSSRWSVIVEPVGPFIAILIAGSVDKTLFSGSRTGLKSVFRMNGSENPIL